MTKTEIVLIPEPQLDKGPYEMAISNIVRDIKSHLSSNNKTLKDLAENINFNNIFIASFQVKFPLKSEYAKEEPYQIYFSLLASQYHLKYARMEITNI